MTEYIDRKALREAFDNADADVVEEYEDGSCDWGFGLRNILEVINGVPVADVAQVRHGRWEFLGPNRLIGDCMCGTCSVCKVRCKYIVNKNICPNCGAKMNEEATDNG